ncbi:MAG: lipoyl synthase, partial [Candidatus Diapherotrites archaeon]|nr:lipoyl synthase [Candidatus Diapherotrites archaeon]
MQSKPNWLTIRPPTSETYFKIRERNKRLKLNTVCTESKCPNASECWSGGTATFMIMGDTCTRGCKFCHVKTSFKPSQLDANEPKHVTEAVKEMKLKYVVLTSVDRDDLPDQGANHFAQTVKEIKKLGNVLVETLTPDFQGNLQLVDTVLKSGLDVYAHNVETVKRLQGNVRDPRANYEQSLNVLKHAKNKGLLTKTSIMVGLGETREEVLQTMNDLRNVGVDFLTLGQYLQPTKQ